MESGGTSDRIERDPLADMPAPGVDSPKTATGGNTIDPSTSAHAPQTHGSSGARAGKAPAPSTAANAGAAMDYAVRRRPIAASRTAP
jgi:hypothetical protein